MKNMRDIERVSGLALLALVIVGCSVVLMPFVSDILWAAVLCYSTWPIYEWLEKKLKQRSSLAAGLMLLLLVHILVLPFAVVGYNFADNVTGLVDLINQYRSSGLPEQPAWLQKIPWFGAEISRYWIELAHNTESFADLLKDALIKSKGWLLKLGLDFGKAVFHLSLSVLIAFFFYRDGRAVATRVTETGQRLLGDYGRYLLGVMGGTIKSVVYGILGTAGVQGIAASIGFAIAGVPSSMLLGLLSFFLALVPGGPPVIWVPVTIWLFVQGHPGWGVFMGIWGFFVISGVDNVVRPYLISRGTPLPFALVLLGVMGGIVAFGFVGLFLGPTLLAVGYCLIREFSQKNRGQTLREEKKGPEENPSEKKLVSPGAADAR